MGYEPKLFGFKFQQFYIHQKVTIVFHVFKKFILYSTIIFIKTVFLVSFYPQKSIGFYQLFYSILQYL